VSAQLAMEGEAFNSSTILVVDSRSACGRALRQSLSDWYERPDPDSDDDASSCDKISGDGEVETADHGADFALLMTPPASPKLSSPMSCSRRRAKRKSLGNWYLDNERRPTGWTPDTKVIYVGDDWEDVAWDYDPILHHQESPGLQLFPDPHSCSDEHQPHRRCRSLHLACAAAKALPSSPSRRADAGDPIESQHTGTEPPAKLASVAEFLASPPVEIPSETIADFIKQTPSSDAPWSRPLTGLWGALEEMFGTAAQSVTIYFWDSVEESLSCARPRSKSSVS